MTNRPLGRFLRCADKFYQFYLPSGRSFINFIGTVGLPDEAILDLVMPGSIVSGLYYVMNTAHFMRRRYRAQEEEEEEAALRLANDQLFVSAATQRSPIFSNQTTTFLKASRSLTGGSPPSCAQSAQDGKKRNGHALERRLVIPLIKKC